MSDSDDFVSASGSSDEYPIFTPSAPVVKDPKLTYDPGENGGISYDSLQSIIKQRESYLKYKIAENERIWGDGNFQPNSALDKIASRIAITQAEQVAKLLGEVADGFIDGLVHSEFFPE